MQSVAPIRTEDYDLTCPITLRTFRDPVKATDGHTYEREAIVRWITDHGTSPLTRQVLDVNDLLSDNHVQDKVGRRTSLAGSSDIKYEPMVYRKLRETPIYDKGLIAKDNNCHGSHEGRCGRRQCYILIGVLSAIILLVCGVAVGLFTRESLGHVESKHSSALTTNSPVYCRGICGQGNYYYEAISVNVAKSGKYRFSSKSHIDTYGYLYKNSFDPLNPHRNLLVENNNSGKKQQFKFKIHLESQTTYILVTTTSSPNVTGSFSIIASGPKSVSFPRTTTVWTTKTLKTTRRATTISSIQSVHRSSLNVGNPMYCRLGKKCSVPSFYYQAIKINASVNGNYRIVSDSNIDTCVYVYSNSFNSSSPTENLLRRADDGDSSEKKPPKLNLLLQSRYNFILVVTTDKPSQVGEFTVTAVGPGTITFL